MLRSTYNDERCNTFFFNLLQFLSPLSFTKPFRNNKHAFPLPSSLHYANLIISYITIQIKCSPRQDYTWRKNRPQPSQSPLLLENPPTSDRDNYLTSARQQSSAKSALSAKLLNFEHPDSHWRTSPQMIAFCLHILTRKFLKIFYPNIFSFMY